MKTPTRIQTRSDVEAVASLLVPLQNKSLLVPNVLIAEVVPLAQTEDVENAPPWLIGFFEWRGERVPLMSFEIANSQVMGRNHDSARIAVLNSVTGQSGYRFFALLVQGIPRMIRLTDQEVREDKNTGTSQAEEMAVITQLGKAMIPNMQYLESLLVKIS